jgi:ribulose-phosphate 3-epimerase
MTKIQIVPSILAFDFGFLSNEVKNIEKAKADAVHVDVMDGHFVPNISLGPKMVSAIDSASDIFIDVHLMCYNPFKFIEMFIQSGADMITFHIEATEDVEDTIDYIHKCNKLAGIAINPETSISMVLPFLSKCDVILLMSVQPGHGGQAFIEDVLEKIKLISKFCSTLKKKPRIQVDGGINFSTAKMCIDAGANSIVSGDFLNKQPSLMDAIEKMRKL